MTLRPWYNKDANYQTNAKSFMDYLARTNHFLEVLIEDYDNFQELVIEELERIKFNAEMEVEDILVNWLEDGTLERIINDEVFGNKADKDWVSDQLTQLREDIHNDLKETTDEVERKLKETTDEVEDQLKTNNDLVNGTIEQVNLLKSKVPSNHHNSESSSTLQQAIYEGEGGVVHIKKGTYLIDTPIKIKSNTKILAYGSIFKRNANIDNMFISYSDGKQGEYNAVENIEIIGATFDGSGGQFMDKCTMLAFGHARNIKVFDCTFKNLVDWHMIELNAVQNALVENCLFENYGNQSTGTEMLQIDVASGTNTFPWYAPYDNTTCDNIKIINNKFINGVRGIGTHTSITEEEHTRITIEGNEFRNMRSEAIYGYDWAFTKIHSNHMYNVHTGIHLRVKGRHVYNHSIEDNYLSGINTDVTSRGIWIQGVEDGVNISEGSIRNNRVKRFRSHGIGIDYSHTWIVEGNEVTSNGRSGIIVYVSNFIVIDNNIVRLSKGIDPTNTRAISLEGASTNIILTSNIFDTLTIISEVSESIVSNNIIHDSINAYQSNTDFANNMVNGEFRRE